MQASPLFDQAILAFDRGLRTVAGVVRASRPSPADAVEGDVLDVRERRRSASLMRVNHVGEVCAQALYDGQALTTQNAETRQMLTNAAREEADHLAWCNDRLRQLDSAPSVLAGAFYAGSYAIGVAAGTFGDRISLGFIEATEDEVCRHLDRHIERLPAADHKSRAILGAIRADESRHGGDALRAGGAVLPKPVKRLMRLASKVMTATTARI